MDLPDLHDIQQSLPLGDRLLAQHLDLVDVYQNEMKTLSEHLAKAFYELAEANKSRGTFQRIGQDCYDYRMKASVGVKLEDHQVLLRQMTRNDIQGVEKEAREKDQRNDEQSGIRKHIENPDLAIFSIDDPIRWFGALPSNSLRLSQVEFKKALDSVISTLNHTINLNLHEIRLRDVPDK
ncbi:hypothetical protein NEOLI_004497 [Neolecta irregularis DAH-3]|uniref:Vacuolar ATPase assembly protein VMA22 n=1 Tax=Neolecta irregularis (strain DAH-3) TaxID=1198029 RepID=A0A1U7LRF3_NEOID|nr:hypothetical protein NEOLI_004497 [Neolecta irregularis DAH-3]|eukprot:OLL25208.1 hypothetical protein NEOLI_004497 [Neolecta irregularis DAH-3]